MKLNEREIRLGLITLVAVLVGLTYWIGEPRYHAWQAQQEETGALLQRQEASQHLINQTDELNERFEALRERLPTHPVNADITALLLRNLQTVADEHDFLLVRREPEAERQLGDLFEMGITATWEGELPALVRFLYALLSQGANVDVRQLTVAPVQGSPQRLRGTVTIDYAYNRASTDS